MGILEALQGIGDLGSSIFNAWNTVKTNEQNQANQETEWRREDSAVQRRVADLKAAGLNPVLAASGAGAPSSLAVRMQAPQFDMPNMSRALAVGITKNEVGKSTAEKQIAEESAARIHDQQYIDHMLMPERIMSQASIVNATKDQILFESQKAKEDARRAVADAEQAEWDLGMSKKYGVASWWMNAINGTANTAGKLTSELVGTKGLGVLRRLIK